MKNGDLLQAANCLEKELRSVEQLKKLFVKGYFDE